MLKKVGHDGRQDQIRDKNSPSVAGSTLPSWSRLNFSNLGGKVSSDLQSLIAPSSPTQDRGRPRRFWARQRPVTVCQRDSYLSNTDDDDSPADDDVTDGTYCTITLSSPRT